MIFGRKTEIKNLFLPLLWIILKKKSIKNQNKWKNIIGKYQPEKSKKHTIDEVD